MKTYDHEQAVAVIAPFKARFTDCSHGEGNACETLDAHLTCCARTCFDMILACRAWATAVFRGEVVFDPAAEQTWRAEFAHLHARATKVWHVGRLAETPCWELPGQNMLGSALQELQWLRENWVAPRLSVAPLPRVPMTLGEAEKQAVRAQLAALPPLQSAGGQ